MGSLYQYRVIEITVEDSGYGDAAPSLTDILDEIDRERTNFERIVHISQKDDYTYEVLLERGYGKGGR